MFVPANNDDRIVDLLKLIAKSTSIDVELAASIINAGMCASGCMAVKPRETSIHAVYPDPVLRADMLTAIDATLFDETRLQVVFDRSTSLLLDRVQ